MENLIKQLNDATRAYDEGKPILSDKEWDDLYFKLVDMERESGITLPDSPTQSISYTVVNALNKVAHSHKMLSLQKTKSVDEVKQFINNKPALIMAKLDGLTCSLTYENGELVMAETRGDGEIGEDILHNARVISSIPKRIRYKERLVVDGEIICLKEDFEKFADEYKNPRNFASGSIRLLDSKECAKRNLTFVAWDVIEGYNDVPSLESKLIHLKYDFHTVPCVNFYQEDNLEDVINNFCDRIKDKYPIDGAVIKFNDVEYGRSLGATSHHFNNAIAFKFYDETYPTNLLGIEWTMGRTGVLTPVAVFEPIDIDGSTVERASLHNISIMTAVLGIPHIGQQVNIFKANQIIPQIHSAVQFEGNRQEGMKSIILIPSVCPVCGKATKIKQDYDTEVLVCSNPDCEGKLINKLDHYCGKKGLDIKGLSKATLEKLINWGWVNSIKDLYTLHMFRPEWIREPGFGVKSVDNILNAIEESKKCDLNAFICAMGIPLIGTSVSKDLVKHFPQWSDFRNAIDTEYKFYLLDNFGATMHNAIINFNYTEFDYIAENYLTFNTTAINNDSNDSLKGMNIVITGKLLLHKNRAELQEKIESCGGKVVGSISKNTHYLINNDVTSKSAKNLSAQKLNIPIVSEDEFIKKFF